MGSAATPNPGANQLNGNLQLASSTNLDKAPARPNILVATNDPEIRNNMAELLRAYDIKVLWAKSVEEVKAVIANEDTAACFCSFWLVDGTYREVVRSLKKQRVEIPAVIVCAPTCPHEYRDYLAALNIRAFDFICHPYRRSDLERILHSAIGAHVQSGQSSVASMAASFPVRDSSPLRRAS
jgi:DNA-binding NtrC family response regulator